MGGAEDAQSDITFLDDSDDSDVEFTSLEIDSDSAKHKRRKQKLVRSIKSLVGKDDGTGRPLNVAIIGPPGVGKSSFINTTAAALSDDRWREFAYSGYHGGEAIPITVFVNTFSKCCSEESEEYQDVLMPNLIDIAGFPNEDNEKWEELLRIVFYGRLSPGESLTSAYEYCQKYGVEGLRQKFAKQDEKLKVDRVIFVASATESVPRNLIHCVLKAARPQGSEKDRGTRTLPIFGVWTKVDQVDVEDEAVQKTEEEFINSLGLGGAKHRYTRCRNYCDDVDKGTRTERVIPALDVPVLRFLRQVCDPVIKVINPHETYNTNPADDIKVRPPGGPTPTPRDGNQGNPNLPVQNDDPMGNFIITLVVVAAEAILIAMLLHWLLLPPFDVSHLTSACATYKSQNFGGQLPGLDEICKNRDNIIARPIILPFLVFVALRVGVVFLLRRLPTVLQR